MPHAPAPPLSRRAFLWACALIILAGAFFRVWVYDHHHSFWKDEVGLARNFFTHDLVSIADPFHDGQAVPIGFAQLSKVAEMAFGHSEHAFWLLSLLLGILLLPLATIIFKRQLPAGAALVGLAALGLNPILIEYSTQFKPYVADCFCALLMMGTFFYYEQKKRGKTLLYLLAGVVSLWLSYASVFVIAGLGLWQLGAATAAKSKRQFTQALLINAALGGLFAVLWTTNYGQLDPHGFFKNFWQPNFPPVPWQPGFLQWCSTDLPMTVGWIFGQTQALMIFFFLAIGIARAWSMNRNLWALLLPVGLTVLAGFCGLYPIFERLELFWAVLLAPFLALGVHGTWELLRKQHRSTTLIFALLVALPFLHPLTNLAFPVDFQQLKQTAQIIQERAKPGDVVYVHFRASELFKYYFKRYPLPKGATLVLGSKSDLNNLAAAVSRYKGKHLYFIFTEPSRNPDEIEPFAQQMQFTGQLRAVLNMNLSHAFELQMK